MDDTLLSVEDLEKLATLPSKDQMIANFARQIQSPVSRLVRVLNNPIVGLATLLNNRMQQLNSQN